MEDPAPKGRPSPYDLLTSDACYRCDLDIPPRGQLRHRPPPNFDDEDGVPPEFDVADLE